MSTHKDGQSTVDGVPLSDLIDKESLGKNAAAFEDFPILIEFIDAKQSLSVQVHPTDKLAKATEGGYGKSEMWYIMDAEDGAGIYLGFKEDVDEATVRQAIREERLTDYLNFYPVKRGESYFIPAGTVHAIGAGCLIAEIQQNSNLTYRVYDFGRLGTDGKTRELHVEKALKAANFKKLKTILYHSKERTAIS